MDLQRGVPNRLEPLPREISPAFTGETFRRRGEAGGAAGAAGGLDFGTGASTEHVRYLTPVRGVLHEQAEVGGREGQPARPRGKSVRWVSVDLRAGDSR